MVVSISNADTRCESMLRILARLGSILDAPAANYADSVSRLLALLCAEADLSAAFALLSVRAHDDRRDPLWGWRPAWLLPDSERAVMICDFVDDRVAQQHYLDDPCTRAVVHDAGEDRVHVNGQLVTGSGWEPRKRADLLPSVGAGDRLVAAVNLGPDVEFLIGCDRERGAPTFCPTDAELVLCVAQGARRLARWVALAIGQPDRRRPLAPRHRKALACLLDGATEEQLAERLGISTGSAHQYVVAVYRHFGVNSRWQLIALWLDHDSCLD
jgi:DNA-binding CsgD family transcriptional regulator